MLENPSVNLSVSCSAHVTLCISSPKLCLYILKCKMSGTGDNTHVQPHGAMQVIQRSEDKHIRPSGITVGEILRNDSLKKKRKFIQLTVLTVRLPASCSSLEAFIWSHGSNRVYFSASDLCICNHGVQDKVKVICIPASLLDIPTLVQ